MRSALGSRNGHSRAAGWDAFTRISQSSLPSPTTIHITPQSISQDQKDQKLTQDLSTDDAVSDASTRELEGAC